MFFQDIKVPLFVIILNELINNEIYDTIINYKPEQEEVSKYNFYFLEEEYKQREHFKLIENSIEQLFV